LNYNNVYTWIGFTIIFTVEKPIELDSNAKRKRFSINKVVVNGTESVR
jgi:hypothetical protein